MRSHLALVRVLALALMTVACTQETAPTSNEGPIAVGESALRFHCLPRQRPPSRCRTMRASPSSSTSAWALADWDACSRWSTCNTTSSSESSGSSC
jgi:hypothetical protein